MVTVLVLSGDKSLEVIMKVLHVITSLETGGAEKLMVDLIPRFINIGIKCDLLTFNGKNTPFKMAIEKAGVKVYDFGEDNRIYSPMNILRMIPFLRRYDIVHTHNTAPQLFAAMGSLLCSVVLCTTEHTTSNRRRGWKWYAPIDRWMYSRYKEIISISDKTQENLESYLPNLKTPRRVIYNGIPLQDYSEAEPNHELIEKYHDKYRITMVAGFRYQKDHPTAIRSLLHLSNKFNLFLVGDGIERVKCEDLVAKLELEDRVHFLGRRHDVASILKASHISLISSHWEGFGLAAVESMAAGCPVIASDIPGVAEVVSGAGLLFQKGNDVDLAAKIKAIVRDNVLRKNTVKKGLERAISYSIEKMVSGYISVYENIYQSRNEDN